MKNWQTGMLATALVAALATTAAAQDKRQLSIATGGTGGVYYPWAAASPTSSPRTSPAGRPPPR